jgi:peptidoglycan/LPS O-acetylase OafA/YrhL
MRSNSLVSKPHFPILDGLRGVAAIMVVAFHIFEVHTPNRFEQIINHGYLAVDFFFMLSGFVIGYAYDDRWKKMSIGNFFRLRLVRLQPMVVMGMIIGATCFYFQDSVLWPEIHNVPLWKVLLIMLIGCFMVPVPTSMDIRGWTEMYPLNGPGWSLFFEYVVNILYAVWIRKFSKPALSILVFLAACFLIHLAVFGANGDVIGGWSLEPAQLHIGLARVLFPFFAGLLLFRIIKLGRIRHAFLLSSLLIMIVLSIPRIGGADDLWMNGIYESLVIIFVFPLIIYIGASSELKSRTSSRISKFLGEISYPIYITHYPIIYIYWAWVHNNKVSLKDAIPVSILVFVSSILVAYTCLKLYDEPVRKWLKRKAMSN